MFSSRFIWNTEINHLTEILNQKKAANEEILDLTISNPTTAGFIYNQRGILNAISMPESLIYQPDPKGFLRSREAIRNYYQAIQREIDPDSIFLTASTSEAYSFLFKLLSNPEQEILVQQPGYPLLDFLSGLELLNIVPYYSTYHEIRGWEIDIDMLRASVTDATSAITIVNPNNPTGACIKKQEISAINRICAKNKLPLIVDEVFIDYTSRKQNNDSFAGSIAGNSDVLTFVLSGLSKVAGLPQVKLGWIVVSGPDDLCCVAKERLEFIADTYLSVATPIQYAAETLLSERDNLQTQIHNRVEQNETYLKKRISGMSHCRMLIREGGWYAILEIQDGISDDERSLQLLGQDNVLVHPGFFFGFDHDGFLIVSLLTPTEIFKQGISRIITRYC